MNKLYYGAALAFMLGLSPLASAQTSTPLGNEEMLFGYYDQNPEAIEEGFGGETACTYNIAMKIPEKFAGSTLKGVLIPLRDTSTTSYMNAWVSEQLPTEPYPVQGDVANYEFKDVTTSFKYHEVIFDEPITVPADGFYIGYTLALDEVNESQGTKLPVSMTVPNLIGEDMLMAHLNGWSGWVDYTYDGVLDEYLTSTMIAILGNVKTKDAAYFEKPNNDFSFLKTENSITIPVRNEGWNGVQSIEYKFTVNGITSEGTYTFNDTDQINSLRQWGAISNATIQLPVIETGGKFNYTLEITKVNGQENTSANAKVEGDVKVFDRLAVRTPLIEEGTSTYCSWCPRLIYGMEVMERLYPESVRIIYHTPDMGYDDPMIAIAKCPFEYSGVPAVSIDRALDPQNVNDKKTVGLESGWMARKSAPTIAEIEGELEWLDADCTQLGVTAKAKFFSNVTNGGYKFDFALLQDGMKGQGVHWQQKNNYAGSANEYSEPEWEIFGKKTNTGRVDGLTYNNVFILGGTVNMKGIAASVPREIAEDDVVEYKHVFNLDKARKLINPVTKGESLIQNRANLKVVAMLINEDGTVENCCILKLSDEQKNVAIDKIVSENRTPVAYFDLTGREVKNPENGLYIVRYSDGITEKIVIR